MFSNTNIRIHGGRLYGKGSARIYVTVFGQDIRQKIRQDVCQRMSEALSGYMNTIIYIYIYIYYMSEGLSGYMSEALSGFMSEDLSGICQMFIRICVIMNIGEVVMYILYV